MAANYAARRIRDTGHRSATDTGAGLTVKGLDRLYGALDAYSKGESRASSYASMSAARVYAGAAEAAVAAATGGDRKLSSINKNAQNPRSLDVIVKRQKVGGSYGPGWVAKAVPGGQWAIVDFGTRPHLIGLGGGRRRPTRRQQARAVQNAISNIFGGSTSAVFSNRPRLAFPDGQVRFGPVLHPGTRGKRTFLTSTRAAESTAKAVWESTYVSESIRMLAGGR